MNVVLPDPERPMQVSTILRLSCCRSFRRPSSIKSDCTSVSVGLLPRKRLLAQQRTERLPFSDTSSAMGQQRVALGLLGSGQCGGDLERGLLLQFWKHAIDWVAGHVLVIVVGPQ